MADEERTAGRMAAAAAAAARRAAAAARSKRAADTYGSSADATAAATRSALITAEAGRLRRAARKKGDLSGFYPLFEKKPGQEQLRLAAVAASLANLAAPTFWAAPHTVEFLEMVNVSSLGMDTTLRGYIPVLDRFAVEQIKTSLGPAYGFYARGDKVTHGDHGVLAMHVFSVNHRTFERREFLVGAEDFMGAGGTGPVRGAMYREMLAPVTPGKGLPYLGAILTDTATAEVAGARVIGQQLDDPDHVSALAVTDVFEADFDPDALLVNAIKATSCLGVLLAKHGARAELARGAADAREAEAPGGGAAPFNPDATRMPIGGQTRWRIWADRCEGVVENSHVRQGVVAMDPELRDALLSELPHYDYLLRELGWDGKTAVPDAQRTRALQQLRPIYYNRIWLARVGDGLAVLDLVASWETWLEGRFLDPRTPLPGPQYLRRASAFVARLLPNDGDEEPVAMIKTVLHARFEERVGAYYTDFEKGKIFIAAALCSPVERATLREIVAAPLLVRGDEFVKERMAEMMVFHKEADSLEEAMLMAGHMWKRAVTLMEEEKYRNWDAERFWKSVRDDGGPSPSEPRLLALRPIQPAAVVCISVPVSTAPLEADNNAFKKILKGDGRAGMHALTLTQCLRAYSILWQPDYTFKKLWDAIFALAEKDHAKVHGDGGGGGGGGGRAATR